MSIMATDYSNNFSSDLEPSHDGGSASQTSAGEHQGEYERGTDGRVSHQDVIFPTIAIHSCCQASCPSGQHYSTSLPVLNQAPSESTLKKIWVAIISMVRALGLGTKSESEEFDGERILVDIHARSLRKDNEELTKRVADKDNQLAECYRECNKQVEENSRKMELATADANRIQRMLQEEYGKNEYAARRYNRQVEVLAAKISKFKSIADELQGQLSSLEQSNSKVVGSTGAHKDSPAVPPNMEKSVFVVKEAAFACAKALYIILREQCHEALPNELARVDERFRKYMVQACICSRMFAGFENDSFLDCAQGYEDFPPANHENTEFFLRNQDLETRHQRYLYEYDELQNLGLQGVMEAMKTNKGAITDSFFLFCYRRLVSTMTSLGLSSAKFMVSENGDNSKDFLLYNLATNPRYCDKFLKPFVNLAMATFLLHRLAFQFQPPARIFRYANGTKFDPTYMENAAFIDDEDSIKELYVGLMLVPGFQVGATIVKCTVYLVPAV